MEGLVINLGLKSVRAIAFGADGEKLASESLPVQTLLRDSWIEQDPVEWWDKSVEVVARVVEDLGDGAPRFVTVTASAACLALTDADGTPVRDAIMVSDRRAVAESQLVADAAAFPDVQAVNASFQADPYFLVPKALWVARNGYGDLVEEEPGGATIRQFDVHQVGPFLRWLQSFAGEAIVVSPRELREEQVALARETAAVYGEGPRG